MAVQVHLDHETLETVGPFVGRVIASSPEVWHLEVSSEVGRRSEAAGEAQNHRKRKELQSC